MMSLPGCAKRADWSQPDDDPFLISNNTTFGVTMVDAGPYVFFGGTGNLYYLDKETERVIFNCIEPTCGHFSVDGGTCTGALWLPMGPCYPKEGAIYAIFQNMPNTLQVYGQYRRDFYPLGVTVPRTGYYVIYQDRLIVYSRSAGSKAERGEFSVYDLETYTLKDTLTAEGIELLYWFAYDESIYYINMAMDLYKQPMAGGEAVLLDTKAERLAIDGDDLYYIKRSEPGGLYRLSLHGGAPSLLIKNAEAFGVGKKYIYYTRYGEASGSAFVADKEGNDEKLFLEDLVYPRFYVFANYDKVIVQDGAHEGVFLADLDGKNSKFISLPTVET
jgi:hypothetical protein